MFINTLKGPYYKKLVGNATRNFADMVISGEMIESAIKSGKIEGGDTTSTKKTIPAKKKEGEIHMVGHGGSYPSSTYTYQHQPPYNPYYPPQNPYYQMTPPQAVCAASYSQPMTIPPNATPFVSQTQNRIEPKYQRPNIEKPKFSPIPLSYTELYPKLLEAKLIAPSFIEPLKPPFPHWYDANATCDYHPGIQGHSIESCTAFKKRVQNLIDKGTLKFDPQDKPNVTRNPLPNLANG